VEAAHRPTLRLNRSVIRGGSAQNWSSL
jgi:hypothetical protein